jgi:hypothetical protein
MDIDHKIETAIANGERNKQTMLLVHNWCRHARVKKVGGTGMVEMETGLPIGHHAMACEYAAASGMATWDLQDAALDFHDRNCIGCARRDPVGIPNISSLVHERDARKQLAEQKQRARLDEANARREARRSVRQALRPQLTPLSATIIDHLEELDQDSPGDSADRLVAVARLAPETFTIELIEHCFALLENREGWFDAPGLRLLREISADPPRLTRCALASLARYSSVAVASEIVESNANILDDSLIAAALPALTSLANPERTIGMSYERELHPTPLLAVHRARPAATETGINQLLDGRDPYGVSAGARTIEVLAESDPKVASRFTRPVVTKLVRAQWLIDKRETGYSGDDPLIHDLANALQLALEQSPNETDELMMQFVAGAPVEGEVRVYQVYSQLVRGRRREDRPRVQAASRVALKRLLDAASQSTNEDVLREVLSAFSYVDDDMSALARAELDAILGTALLTDDRLRQFDAEPAPKGDMWSTLGRNNRRHVWVQLQDHLIEWAAKAASGDAAATAKYIEIYAAIPEDRDMPRSALIRNVHPLMRLPDGVNAVLPTLYSAMLGSASRVRAAAAEAIGELRGRVREDLPELLYEAFSALLTDSYVIVHRAALKTLDHLKLSEELERRAKAAVGVLLESYALSHQDDRFLLDCIVLYLRRFTTEVERQGQLGRFIIALLEKIESEILIEEISALRHVLSQVDGFAPLVVQTLASPQLTEYRQEDILRALNALPLSAIQAQKSHLHDIALAPDAPRALAANLVETLTRASAWTEAARINEAIHAQIPDTTEMLPRRLMANLGRIATKYEEAIALGNLDALTGLGREWRETEQRLEADGKEHASRRNPFPGFPGSH